MAEKDAASEDRQDRSEDSQHDDSEQDGGKRQDKSGSGKKPKNKDDDNENGDEEDDEDGKDKKDASKDKKDGGKDDKEGKDGKKSRWPIVVVVLVGLLAVVAGFLLWFLTRNQESTDDAYTEGNAISIAPKISGYVIERRVDDNTFVHAGDIMLRIDPRDYITARDQARGNLDLALAQLQSSQIDLAIARVRFPNDQLQAEAQLDQARANQVNAGREFQRQRTVDQRATTQSAVDQAATQYKTATATAKQATAQLHVNSLVEQNIASAGTTMKQRRAQVEQAQANLAQAELNLSYTVIRAPQDGKVTRRNFDVGTYAQAAQQIFYITSPATWIVANFKETQLNRMRIGQPVTISVDAYDRLKLHGHVQSIQQGSGARFTTFPQENATGNFVKIVRRVPVKIVIDNGIDPREGLPLGLSVEPTVDVR